MGFLFNSKLEIMTMPAKKNIREKTPAKTKQTKRIAPPLQKKGKGFYIVGMGASAGGLEAFEKFFQNMSSDSGMAFVLVPHLDPTHVSIMPDLLKKYTKMRVLAVEDGMEVQPNFAYVIPPNKDLAILNGTLLLIDPIDARGKRLPIDYFFRSLAQDWGERAICVILSGTGTDGTLGLKAIKGELGMTMVQDPDSAKYDGMPRSAIQSDLVDYILPPEKMPEQLIKYMKHAIQRVAPGTAPVEGTISDVLPKIFVLLRSHTGHDFSLYKKNTLCRRIERRMNVHQIDMVSNYIRYLHENPHELGTLFKELLIGVTNFFRDPEAFEVLRKVLLKQFANRPNDYSLRVWVPGCANGEEAYSIAIIIRECMDELKRNFDVQIFGTDIDSDAIDTARAGIYPESISADVNADRLKRFFIKEEGVYKVRKEVREMLVFAPQSIIKDPPFTKLDLLCCRNLLIYLDSKLQEKILPLFNYSLKADGILFLGSSETIGRFADLFSVVDQKWKIYKRKDAPYGAHAIIELPVMPKRDMPDDTRPQGNSPNPREPNISRFVEKTLLEKYAPPCVIVDQKGEILYLHGQTGKYLAPAPGRPRWNIVDMAREGLKLQLPSAIRKAISQKKDVTYEGLRVKDNGGFILVNLTVRPVSDPQDLQGMIMVVFEDVTTPKQAESGKTKRRSKKNTEIQLEALEQELQHTKENLRTTVEELETSNEELKSTNEELQSTNEELQSTNEELETSKEELQSLNEELVTVNSELEGKIEDLTKSHNDIRNFMDSTEIATIFLDDELRIKRFTPPATKLVNVIETDMGRPIGHISANLAHENLVKDAEEVLKTLVLKETEVRTKDGHWYFMRIFPYRTIENVIDGVVITFVDIHEQKIATEKTREFQEYAESIVDTVREPLIVLNKDLQVVSANRAFFKVFQVSPEETEGRLIYDLGNRQWDIPKLRELLEEIIPDNTSFEGYEVEHKFRKIGPKKMILNARKIIGKTGGAESILLAIEDFTK